MTNGRTKKRRKADSDVMALLHVLLEQLDRDSERERVVDMAQSYFQTDVGQIFTRHLLRATLVAACEAYREQERRTFYQQQVIKVRADEVPGAAGDDSFKRNEFHLRAGDAALLNDVRLLLNRHARRDNEENH